MNVDDIRHEFLNKYITEDFITDKDGGKIIELIGTSFVADEPFIFGIPNEDYIDRELDWYISQSLFVEDIPGKTPAIWKAVASKEGKINSNYGWCIYSAENGFQYDNVLRELIRFPDSRRTTMIYTRPSMWTDYNKDGMSDFICTNAVSYFIRDYKLHVCVSMRSNDAWAGYRNDYAWQKSVQNTLVHDLNTFGEFSEEITAGDIYWKADSLHVYERNFWMIEGYRLTNNPQMLKADVENFIGK